MGLPVGGENRKFCVETTRSKPKSSLMIRPMQSPDNGPEISQRIFQSDMIINNTYIMTYHLLYPLFTRYQKWGTPLLVL